MPKIFVAGNFKDFSRILAGEGYEIIEIPLIETQPLADLSELNKKIESLAGYEGIFLTSKNAAKIFAESLGEKVFGGKVYVLGKRSFEILQKKNLNLYFDESANTAGEMLEKIPPEELKNKRLLFIRGDRSLRVVPEFLEGLAEIDEVIVYETRQARAGIDKIKSLREKFERAEIAGACFFSPSAGESFIEQFGAEVLKKTSIAAIGATTAEFFEKQNLKVGFIASKADAEDFAFELIKFLRKN